MKNKDDFMSVEVKERKDGTYVVLDFDDDLYEFLQECGVDQDLKDLGELVEVLEYVVEWLGENTDARL